MRYLIWLILIAIPSITTAETISKYDDGSAAFAGVYGYGQSVLTPSGGPWTNITFGFLRPDDSGVYSTQYSGGGPLFLLTQEYTGLSSLSQGAPGFLATGNTPSAFLASASQPSFAYWEFDSLLILAPNTRYYFYSSQGLSNVGQSSFAFPIPDEEPTNQGYTTWGLGGRACGGINNLCPAIVLWGPLQSSTFSTPSFNYVLTGVVPEPESYAMLFAGLGLLGFVTRRRKQKSA